MARPIPDAFARIREAVHAEFRHYSEEDLATAFGVLLVTWPPEP